MYVSECVCAKKRNTYREIKIGCRRTGEENVLLRCCAIEIVFCNREHTHTHTLEHTQAAVDYYA